MNYTVSNMERLGAAFEKVYVIMGNHDLYYREKREIQDHGRSQYYYTIYFAKHPTQSLLLYRANFGFGRS